MDDLTRELQHRDPEPDADARPTPKRSGLKRILGLSLGTILILAMVAGGIWYWLSTKNFVTTDDAFVDSYTTQVAPRVAGQVTKLLFADNEHVAAGQTLLLIDPRDYQAKLDQAKAQQASAQASAYPG